MFRCVIFLWLSCTNKNMLSWNFVALYINLHPCMIALAKGCIAIRHQADFKEQTTYQFTDVKALSELVKRFEQDNHFYSIYYY